MTTKPYRIPVYFCMGDTIIVSPVRSTYGGYYGLVVVTPCPRPHFIVYAITLKNLIGLLPYFICRLIYSTDRAKVHTKFANSKYANLTYGPNTHHQYSFAVNTQHKILSAFYQTRIDTWLIMRHIAQHFHGYVYAFVLRMFTFVYAYYNTRSYQ